ncbi:hypothetical protein [Aquimarina algiphila]|uniref:Uncharacterized protein n=1 Tax=Aquimarina algiphila TaxID=2047982 RepID=A0A554VQY9_9FLAO|nr:hypothetical protein [Aquimarina algiphila]TSE11030.1 hypothetical protein FOF46_02050 [Aquimarina algiphila]
MDIAEWKGQDIVVFQEDLQKQVKATISEKSFYSYFKNSSEKLPRVDILNLLSRYCGYINWNDFKNNHNIDSNPAKPFTIPKWFWIVIFGFGVFISIYFLIPTKRTFTFCFIDQDRNQPLTKIPIDIIILNDKESPFHSKSDSLGCFTWKTEDDFIHFIIQSPYHKTDTIYRIASSDTQEELQIQTDDYALMLHYYANGKVKDWKNRKKELSRIIANNATIFQVLPYGLGIEIHTKDEFINKLTTPTKSLKNIEIIESRRLNGQIVKLKFKVKS